MEFRKVVSRRRMVRTYDTSRQVPRDVVERIVHSALRAPSAGFSQGTGLLVLDTAADVARFRRASTPPEGPENWFAAQVDAPVVIAFLSNKDAYLDRYAQPDKGFVDRSDAWWPSPYWDIDAGMGALLALLAAVDEGLGACFFGISIDCIGPFRAEFGVPPEFKPIGAVSIGYSTEPPRDLASRRKQTSDVVRYGNWTHGDEASPRRI